VSPKQSGPRAIELPGFPTWPVNNPVVARDRPTAKGQRRRAARRAGRRSHPGGTSAGSRSGSGASENGRRPRACTPRTSAIGSSPTINASFGPTAASSRARSNIARCGFRQRTPCEVATHRSRRHGRHAPVAHDFRGAAGQGVRHQHDPQSLTLAPAHRIRGSGTGVKTRSSGTAHPERNRSTSTSHSIPCVVNHAAYQRSVSCWTRPARGPSARAQRTSPGARTRG
jgi:hypothetical protein